MKEKVNVIMVPSIKANTYIYKGQVTGSLEYAEPNKNGTCSQFYLPQHLYFTSLPTVNNKGDHFIFFGSKETEVFAYVEDGGYGVRGINDHYNGYTVTLQRSCCSGKIVATTDPALWKLGVPKIGLDFVQAYVEEKGLISFVNVDMIDKEPTKVRQRANKTVCISPVQEIKYTEVDLEAAYNAGKEGQVYKNWLESLKISKIN